MVTHFQVIKDLQITNGKNKTFEPCCIFKIFLRKWILTIQSRWGVARLGVTKFHRFALGSLVSKLFEVLCKFCGNDPPGLYYH
jgi:hypothetical protein